MHAARHGQAHQQAGTPTPRQVCCAWCLAAGHAQAVRFLTEALQTCCMTARPQRGQAPERDAVEALRRQDVCTHMSMLQVRCGEISKGEPLPPVPGWPATRPQCPAARAAKTRSRTEQSFKHKRFREGSIAHVQASSCLSRHGPLPGHPFPPHICFCMRQSAVKLLLPNHCTGSAKYASVMRPPAQSFPLHLSWHAQHRLFQAGPQGLRLPGCCPSPLVDLSFSVSPREICRIPSHKHLPGCGDLQTLLPHPQASSQRPSSWKPLHTRRS